MTTKRRRDNGGGSKPAGTPPIRWEAGRRAAARKPAGVQFTVHGMIS
jgi:hypothetical protein